MYVTSQLTIQIHLIAALGKYGPPQGLLIVTLGETVLDVIRRLGINAELVQMAFADGKLISFDTTLDNTRKLLLLPAINGG